MSFNARAAAEKLFEIADAIEKQASEKTFFVCEGCNHTASLETINSSRAKFAFENQIESVASITVEDTIACRACGGDMKYAATEESEKFFIEAASKKSEDEEDTTDEDSVDEPEEEVSEEETTDEVSGEDAEDDSEEEEEKPKKKTTKDKEDSDGKVEMKKEPKVQFDGEDKKASKTAFDVAVDRYSM